MTVREIIFLPDPVLRRKARKVTDFGKDMQQLIDDMIDTMRVAPGVGLAAPQIGISQKVIVVEFGNDEVEDAPLKLYIVVNPEIINSSDESIDGIEACLSVPGLVGNVERQEHVVVKGVNRFGEPVKIKANGWLARIFQHEIDHLNGIVFTDRAECVWKPEETETYADV
ncbi:MAG: peptide deformylase [Anaerolineaceae bacterium]|nr:peptide deformylase [Anaerolineaceae bacterium]